MTNRPIKFRCWHKTDSKMLTQQQTLDSICRLHRQDGGFDDVPLLRFILMIPQQDVYVLQQFTNLLDKNGKEICEGDILKAKSYEDWGDKDGFYYNHEVKFSTNKAGITNLAGFLYIPEDCEIIGNIFENPELLKP